MSERGAADLSLDDKVDAAMARLDAKASELTEAPSPGHAPGFVLRCEKCGHSDRVKDDPKQSEYRCDECGTLVIFGVPMPKISHLPEPEDARFLRQRVEDHRGRVVTLTLERRFMSAVAIDMLSVSLRPEVFMRVLHAIGSPAGAHAARLAPAEAAPPAADAGV